NFNELIAGRNNAVLGWCPMGNLAEDGIIPYRYQLIEIANPSYSQRTERNILESDATLIFGRSVPLSEGTLFTEETALKHRKPCLVVYELNGVNEAVRAIQSLLKQNRIEVLNVAGPRESQAPSLASFVRHVLGRVFSIT